MEFDFKANQEVATLDAVPNDFKPLYVEKADKTGYKLDTEDKKVQSAVSAVTGLSAALKAARADAKQKIDLTPLKDFGDTPESIKAKVDEIVSGYKEQVKGVNIEKIKADLEKDVNVRMAAKDKQIENQEKEFHDVFVTDRGNKAIEAAKGNAELLLPVLMRNVVGRRVEGKYQVFVLDDAGDIRYSGVTGAPLSISERVTELKNDKRYGVLFESPQRGGGGATPGGSANPRAVAEQQRRVQSEGGSPVSKISAGLRRGLATQA